MATAKLAHVPLLAPGEAGLPQSAAQSVGLVSHNADPTCSVPNVKVVKARRSSGERREIPYTPVHLKQAWPRVAGSDLEAAGRAQRA